MQPFQKLASYKHVVYLFNPQTGHYQKSTQQPEKLPTNCLPFELKRETTQAAQIKCNAVECLTLREYKKTNGSRKMLTGLNNTSFKNWYMGDHRRKNAGEWVKSLLIIHFSNDNSRMDIFFFSGFYKVSPLERRRYVDAAIPCLLTAIS